MRKKLSSWPPVYLDDTLKVNGNNNPFRIVMNPNAPAWISVYAQERREWPLRWIEVLVQLTIVGLLFRRRVREWIEELGHAAEIAVRVERFGETYESAELDEATAMLDPGSSYSRKGLWKDKGIIHVLDALRAKRAGASRWVRRHRAHLDRIEQKISPIILPETV